MKRIFLFITLIFAASGCRKVKRAEAEKSDTSTADGPEQLEIKEAGLYLSASKKKDGKICLKYRLRYSNADSEFCFKYFDYSDVVFPDTAIGIISDGSTRKSSYYLMQDSILILPLIAMNNTLSVYVINLRSREVLSSDMRTSFELVWVNERKLTLLISDTPGYINDTILFYKLNKYRIGEGGMTLVDTDTAQIGIASKDDLQYHYLIAKRMLD